MGDLISTTGMFKGIMWLRVADLIVLARRMFFPDRVAFLPTRAK